jgi:hypothetical protein
MLPESISQYWYFVRKRRLRESEDIRRLYFFYVSAKGFQYGKTRRKGISVLTPGVYPHSI